MILLNRNSVSRATVTRLILLSLCLISGLIGGKNVEAHIFDRGHIERSIDVVIRDRDVDIRYAIGLSDETMLDMLIEAEAIEGEEAADFRAAIDALPKSDAQSPADAANAIELAPLDFQTQLLKRFVDQVGSGLSHKIVLMANDTAIDFRSQSISISPRNHVAMEIRLRATLPAADALKIKLTDSNFLGTKPADRDLSIPPDPKPASFGKSAANEPSAGDHKENVTVPCFSGNLRLACRARGDAILLNSSVAPVLARAESTELGQLDHDGRVAAATILAKLAFAAGSPAPASGGDQ